MVLLTTPDRLRGRAISGHLLAAYAANSVGQLYVAAMVGAVGAGVTMRLGGVLTEVMTILSVWRIPALITQGTQLVATPPAEAAPAGTATSTATPTSSAHGPTAALRATREPEWDTGAVDRQLPHQQGAAALGASSASDLAVPGGGDVTIPPGFAPPPSYAASIMLPLLLHR